jgi:hypothetical protein
VTFGTSTSDSICLPENHQEKCGCTELEITNHVIDPIVDIFTGGDCDSLNVVTSASEKIFIWYNSFISLTYVGEVTNTVDTNDLRYLNFNLYKKRRLEHLTFFY